MRFEKTALLGALLFAFSANAQDVMVDLSVLDDLDTPYSIDSKPLFPVLAQDPIKITRTNVVKTKSAIKKYDTKNKVKVSKDIVKASAEAKEDIAKANVEVKEAKKEEPVVKVAPLDENIVVVDVEPVSAPKTVPQVASAKLEVVEPSQPKTESVKVESKATVTLPKDEKAPLPTVLEKNIEQDPIMHQDKKAPLQTIETNSPKVEDSKVSADKGLIVEDIKAASQQSDSIKFATGVDTLNDEQKTKIDSIVSDYQNGPKNKIAIYSYNLDDGVDSFKKKRISLNRAIEIRSYLLKKGYKNFSIKVINIGSTSEKVNTVKLKEI